MMSIKQQEPGPEPKETVSGNNAPVSETVSAQEKTEDPARAEQSVDSSESDTDADRIALLEAELAAAREELSVVNDKYLRKLAEDVNFRKRMTREKEDGQRFALTSLLGDIIPVLDDFDRAIASAETQKDYAVLHDGVLIIRRQLGSMLEAKYGLTRFESLGQPFDPNHHEAVAMVQGGPEDGDEAVVAEEFLPGYGLSDRILRTAKVKVRMPAPAAPTAASEAPSGAPEAR
jgi:molecular chaperone GrpE